MLRNSSLLFVATALAVGFSADGASAQTFQACRVPSVGVIYMINVGDAPTACLDASHVQFSWTEGGAPADGSITTAKLADNAVTSAKVANGSITPADLAAPAGVEFNNAEYTNFDPVAAAQTAGSLTVSVPAAGYIVAHGLGQILCSIDTSVYLGFANNTTSYGTTWTNYIGVTNNYTMVYKQDVIPVAAAGNVTLNFNVGLATDNCSYFRVINFDAIYVPVRY